MYVIISGANRVEFCEVKRKKDFDRRFFLTRGQLYFIPTNGMVRMRIIEYGKERPSEAAIAYEENSIVPYDTCGLKYNMDNFLCDIDRYKQMTNYSWFKSNRPWIENVGRTAWKFFTAPVGLVALVLAYVFLTGGV